VSSGSATKDLQIGSTETDVSASGLWSQSYVTRPDTIWRLPRFVLVAGVVLGIAASPATAIPDLWSWERRRRDASVVTWVSPRLSGRPISWAAALLLSRTILERAERERAEIVEWEAKRGMQWEEGG